MINCLETYLRCFVTDNQNKWFQWLHLAKWWYNSTYHTSEKMTPFQDLYGYEPTKWKDIIANQARVASVNDHLEENQRVDQILKENLNVLKNRTRKKENQHQT